MIAALKNKTIINSASLLTYKGFAILSSLVCLPIFINRYETERFGIYILATVVIDRLFAFDNWLYAPTVRCVAEYTHNNDRKKFDESLSNLQYSNILFGSFAFVILAAFIPLSSIVFKIDPQFQRDTSWVFIITAIVSAGKNYFSFYSATLDGFQLQVVRSISSSAYSIIALVVAFHPTFTHASFLQFSAILLSARLVPGILNFSYLKQRRLAHRNGPKRPSMQSSLVKSIKSVLSVQTLVTINSEAPKLIAGIMIGPTSVAILEIISRPIHSIASIFSQLGFIVAPKLSQYNLKTKKIEGVFLLKAMSFFRLIFYPASLTCLAFSENFVVLWFGEQYHEYAYLSKIASISLLIYANSIILSRHYIFTLKISKLAKYIIISTSVHLCMLFILGDILGVVGIVVSTISYQFIEWLILRSKFKYHFKGISLPQETIYQSLNITYLAIVFLVFFYGNFQASIADLRSFTITAAIFFAISSIGSITILALKYQGAHKRITTPNC
ncbi:hypothetical protein MLD52_15205 [Puniceicoccaceae bacterium K14]|nr:hypothetical protein [Puniceicoccaceae bacterium K14]